MATIKPPQNMHTQRKRKAEEDVRPSTKKPVQKRASAACRSCRARKVRCDVLLKSTPCTNCRLDGAECIIAESKRTKFARTADGTTLVIGNSQRDADDKDWNAANMTPDSELIKASASGSVERSNGTLILMFSQFQQMLFPSWSSPFLGFPTNDTGNTPSADCIMTNSRVRQQRLRIATSIYP